MGQVLCRCHVCGAEFALSDLDVHRFSKEAEHFADGRLVLACQKPDGGPAHPTADVKRAWEIGTWREAPVVRRDVYSVA